MFYLISNKGKNKKREYEGAQSGKKRRKTKYLKKKKTGQPLGQLRSFNISK